MTVLLVVALSFTAAVAVREGLRLAIDAALRVVDRRRSRLLVLPDRVEWR